MTSSFGDTPTVVSVCQSVCLSVCLFVVSVCHSLSVGLFICEATVTMTSPFGDTYTVVSVFLSVYLSVCRVCLSCLSVCHILSDLLACRQYDRVLPGFHS